MNVSTPPTPPHPTPKTSKKHGLLEAPIPKTWNTLLLYPACEHVSKQESDTVVNPCRPNNKPQWDVVEWISMIFYHLVHYQLIIQYHLVSHPISFGLISSNIYWIYSSFWCHIFHIPHLDTSPEPWHSGTSPEHLAAEAASVAWASLTSVSSFPFPSTTGMKHHCRANPSDNHPNGWFIEYVISIIISKYIQYVISYMIYMLYRICMNMLLYSYTLA